MPQFIIFFILSSLLTLATCEDTLGEVVFTSIIWRHGDRTPINFYPNDPYVDPIYWPEGLGQLTATGKKQHYELGKFLRKRYSSLVSSQYHVNDIYIRTTDVDRAIMSAESNMAGFYEPDNLTTNWNPQLKWEPLPIHSVQSEYDTIISPGDSHYCPKWEVEVTKLLLQEPFLTIQKENTELFSKLSEGAGMPILNLKEVNKLSDTLYSEKTRGLPLPPWTVGLFPEKTSSIADYALTINCYTPLLARLQIGNLVKDMLTHMQKKSAGLLYPDRKAWIYSGHDTTVADFLQALRVFDIKHPPYASAVIVELSQLNEDYFVSIHYRNTTELPPYLLTIPSCTPFCPLDKFSEIVLPILPVDREKECNFIDPVTLILKKL